MIVWWISSFDDVNGGYVKRWVTYLEKQELAKGRLLPTIRGILRRPKLLTTPIAFRNSPSSIINEGKGIKVYLSFIMTIKSH
jgi:hypothetical protein